MSGVYADILSVYRQRYTFMNVSLSWIFDHINASWRDCSLSDLFDTFTKKTAEIERIVPVRLDPDNFTLVEVIGCEGDSVLCKSSEWHKTYSLPVRPGVIDMGCYLVIKQGKTVRWATARDVGGDKDTLLPALAVSRDDCMGSWKDAVEWEDYILEISSTAITHRPDLWSHRGLAREFAAHHGWTLLDEKKLCAPITLYEHETTLEQGDHGAWFIERKTPACVRLATLFVPTVRTKHSVLWMALRLARCNIRAHQALIDATNYVMADLGQPMHVFDAAELDDHTLEARMARMGEEIVLLDGSTCTLSSNDIVIADAHKPVSLAGIMGGEQSGVTYATESVIIESGCFDASTIRASSKRHALRTESSVRFEKSLDPHAPHIAIQRYVQLLHDMDVQAKYEPMIRVVGEIPAKTQIVVDHALLTSRLGIDCSMHDIKDRLKALGFSVAVMPGKDARYKITVPSWRATGDISLPEDIVEEIGRSIGYDALPMTPPVRTMSCINHQSATRMRERMDVCVSVLGMTEQVGYGIVDASFARRIGYDRAGTVALAYPLSENWQRLTPSLAFNLLKAAEQAAHVQATASFVEEGRCWDHTPYDAHPIQERHMLAGVWYMRIKDTASRVNEFYVCKRRLETLQELLGWSVSWHTPTDVDVIPEWYDRQATAVLKIGDVCVGYAGYVSPVIAHTLFEQGDAFIWEYSVTPCEHHRAEADTTSRALSTFSFDISMLIPDSHDAAWWCTQLLALNKSLIRAIPIDVFTKPEWHGKRSLTIRCYGVQEDGKTIDEQRTHLYEQSVACVSSHGAQVR